MYRRIWTSAAVLSLGIPASLASQAPRGISLDATLLSAFRGGGAAAVASGVERSR